MNWLQTLIVALISMVSTKVLDSAIAVLTEKRQFRKYKREKVFDEIESLKSEIGIIYELSMSWEPYDVKKAEYIARLSNDHQLIGKYSKYPNILTHARDVIHFSGIVASAEKAHESDLPEHKVELDEKHRNFLQACDNKINNLI